MVLYISIVPFTRGHALCSSPSLFLRSKITERIEGPISQAWSDAATKFTATTQAGQGFLRASNYHHARAYP